MSTPLFTIGISFRNPGDYFVLALKSVFAQTFSDWELLLVDDGSEDGSGNLAKRIDDTRVRVFIDGANRNLNVRLNQMVNSARGRYFVRMDADDVMHPQRLEKLLVIFEHAHDNTVVGSACYSINEKSVTVGWRPAARKQLSGFSARRSFHHPTVAARTEWFRDNPYSEHFLFHRSQDAELWCRTADTSTFVWSQDFLLYYRELGTFSYQNYLGTTLGVLFLARHHTNGTARYGVTLAKELAKCWMTSFAWACGHSDWIIRRRYRSINEQCRKEAERGLDVVNKCVLPLLGQGDGEGAAEHRVARTRQKELA